MLTPLPFNNPNPVEAIHAAPKLPKDTLCGVTILPAFTDSIMFSATNFAVMPEGMPVRGGAGNISVPLALFRGFEIVCGGAKAIPGAKILG